MSAQAIGVPAAEQAIAQRVEQLQAMIEQTRQLAAGGTLPSQAGSSSSQPVDFATALQVATTADANSADATTADYTPTAYATSAVPAQASEYDSLIEQAAQRNGVEPALLQGLIQQESGFNAGAQSSAGASGLTQLMPGTAASMGVLNTLDPAESIEGGARYLGQLMRQFGGNASDALAAYNAGPGAVEQYGGVPPYAETESYVSKVLGYAEGFRASTPAGVLS
jgi:soluble lytic murein transglycosylase-like protein